MSRRRARSIERDEQEVQRRAAAHELHRLEQLAERTAGDHHRERLVAVHHAVGEVREAAARRTARSPPPRAARRRGPRDGASQEGSGVIGNPERLESID